MYIQSKSLKCHQTITKATYNNNNTENIKFKSTLNDFKQMNPAGLKEDYPRLALKGASKS